MTVANPDALAKMQDAQRERRIDLSERESIEEIERREERSAKVKRIPPPEGVWEGSLRDLNARDIEAPKELAGLGTVPVTAGAKVVLYGPPSSTKTLLALRAAVQVALGGGNVWVLEGEGHEYYFRRRLNRIARGLAPKGLGDAEDRIRITHKPFVLSEGLAYWRARLSEWKPALIVLDPLVDYSDANENDSKEMRAYLRLVQIATDQYGAAANVCHHSTKPNDKGRISERGSTAIKGWSDVHIKVLPEPSMTEAGLRVARMVPEKGRDSASESSEAYLRWTFREDAITLAVEEVASESRHEEHGSPPPSSSRSSHSDKRAKVDDTRRSTIVRLLGTRGPMAKEELRSVTGWGGALLNALLEPLFLAGQIHMVQELAVNAAGKRRRLDRVRLGPPPETPPATPSGTGSAPDPVSEPKPTQPSDITSGSDTGSDPASDTGSDPVSEPDPASARLSPEDEPSAE